MLWIMVLGAACVVLGIFNAVWGFVEALMLRRARRAPAKAEGVVCGLVRHRLPMRYEKQGDVPKVAYQYWGRTTANGAHGFLSIPQAMTQWNWYPCVRFTVNGGETDGSPPEAAGKERGASASVCRCCMTLRAPANMRWTETPLRCTLCVPISYGLWCLPRQAPRCWRCILFEARRRARRSI